jgi:hypothetical protein
MEITMIRIIVAIAITLAVPAAAQSPPTNLSASDRVELQILGKSAALAIGNEAVTRQVGRGNVAIVQQAGAGNIAIQDQMGDINLSDIGQTGAKNSVTGTQIGTGVAVQIHQTGGATVTVVQRRQ